MPIMQHLGDKGRKIASLSHTMRPCSKTKTKSTPSKLLNVSKGRVKFQQRNLKPLKPHEQSQHCQEGANGQASCTSEGGHQVTLMFLPEAQMRDIPQNKLSGKLLKCQKKKKKKTEETLRPDLRI